MQAQINRITDILRRDDGISGAMHYTEQISWILFLKFLDDYEKTKKLEAELSGKKYEPLLNTEYQRDTRATPKTSDGKIDTHALSGDDLKDFVNTKLFPYLKSFRETDRDYHSMKYKIGEIFGFITNRIESWHTLREIIDIIDSLSFQSSQDLFELSKIYEDLLQGMWNDWGNAGEYYTPRNLIKAIVTCVDPQIWQTIYDGAAGSCGFLIEAYNYLQPKAKTTKDKEFLNRSTFFGNEKTPLAYILGVMNMILHGIENPNINKENTLTEDIHKYSEADRFDIILANPPFWGKEKDQIQQNFPIKTNATEMLFIQHFMKKLKIWWKAAIIVPEWVLFSTANAFQQIKKQLLEDFNITAIVSLPAGVFLPYAWVKTNVIFFERTGSTSQIRYYEVDPSRKLTKNKPLTSDELSDMINSFKHKKLWEHSWIVNVNDIIDYDLSAKNPAKVKTTVHESPQSILDKIEEGNKKIDGYIANLKKLIRK